MIWVGVCVCVSSFSSFKMSEIIQGLLCSSECHEPSSECFIHISVWHEDISQHWRVKSTHGAFWEELLGKILPQKHAWALSWKKLIGMVRPAREQAKNSVQCAKAHSLPHVYLAEGAYQESAPYFSQNSFTK